MYQNSDNTDSTSSSGDEGSGEATQHPLLPTVLKERENNGLLLYCHYQHCSNKLLTLKVQRRSLRRDEKEVS